MSVLQVNYCRPYQMPQSSRLSESRTNCCGENTNTAVIVCFSLVEFYTRSYSSMEADVQSRRRYTKVTLGSICDSAMMECGGRATTLLLMLRTPMGTPMLQKASGKCLLLGSLLDTATSHHLVNTGIHPKERVVAN